MGVPQAAYDEVPRAVHSPWRPKWNPSLAFKKRQESRHIFTPSEQMNYFVRGLQKSILEEMVDEVRHFLANARSNCIAIRRIASVNGRFATGIA